jgi:CHAT domain-containing protein
LHQVPFEALYMADGPLVNTHVVSSVPSATVWAAARLADPQPRSGFAVLAVGAGPGETSGTAVKTPPINRTLFDFDGSSLPELRSANTEAITIGQLFGGSGTVLVGENATEVKFKALPLSGFSIMHFATHGVTSRKFPDRSALVLHAGSGGTSEDGLLQAREIANLALSAELVTLSACQTASGRLLGTEGIANLVRPFFIAGAKTVVGTLWETEDEFSRALMTAFYKKVQAGMPKGDALTAAKRELIKQLSPQIQPKHWAAFVLYGDASRPVTTGESQRARTK